MGNVVAAMRDTPIGIVGIGALRFELASTPRFRVLGLRQMRRRRGWTFKDLSQRVGVSIGFLNDIEKGRRGVSVRVAERLTDVFVKTSP